MVYCTVMCRENSQIAERSFSHGVAGHSNAAHCGPASLPVRNPRYGLLQQLLQKGIELLDIALNDLIRHGEFLCQSRLADNLAPTQLLVQLQQSKGLVLLKINLHHSRSPYVVISS